MSALPEIPEALKGRELPDIFLAYQQALMVATAKHQVTLNEKSRRIGATWGVAADAVLTSAAARSAGGMDTLYIGYNLDMAREFIDVCAMWAKFFSQAANEVEELIFLDQDRRGETREIKAYRISFASGFEIMALSSRPRSLRGRQGFVIIDEAAFHEELAELMKAAIALLIWGGKILVISTHNGEMNYFNQLLNDSRAGRNPYHIERTTFDEALTAGLYKRICLVTQKAWSAKAEAEWRQGIINFYGGDADEELFCIAREGSGTFLSGTLIEARMEAGIPVIRWERESAFAEEADHIREADCDDWCEKNLKPLLADLDANLESVLGEDFGRSGDLTVLWPMQIRRDLVRATPFIVELRNIPFRQQEQILYYVCDRLPRFRAAALDARGNGQYMAERAMQKYGSGRVEQVMLSQEWYRENMAPYKAAFEDATITLPKDADVLQDHRMIVMDKGVAKVPDNARAAGVDGKQRHGDSAIAGALAWFASSMDVAPIEYLASGETRQGLRAFAEPGRVQVQEIDSGRGFGVVEGGGTDWRGF